MPEGPEVRIMAEQMDSYVKNLTCSYVYVNQRNRYFTEDLFHSDYFLKLLKGKYKYFPVNSKIESIYSVGKKIIFNFGEILFISSCLMNGRWTFEEVEHFSLCIIFEDKKLFYYDESFQSLFSIVDINSENHREIMKGVGPDYFHIEYEEFYNKIKRRKSKEIQNFLMDQKEFSGIGNYLKSEILYASRIRPNRIIEDLSDDELEIIFKNIKEIMNLSYMNGGFTLESYHSPAGQIGTYQPLIYMKRRIENMTVEKMLDSNKRSTYWCPEVQI